MSSNVVTWPVLLSGTLGSVIGVLGAVAASLLVIRHERRMLRTSAEDARLQAQVRQRVESVARVQAAVSALAREMSLTPLTMGKGRMQVLDASLAFFVNHVSDHPDVTEWVMHQQGELQSAFRRYQRCVFLPWRKQPALEATAALASELTTRLVAWKDGLETDDWFREAQASRETRAG